MKNGPSDALLLAFVAGQIVLFHVAATELCISLSGAEHWTRTPRELVQVSFLARTQNKDQVGGVNNGAALARCTFFYFVGAQSVNTATNKCRIVAEEALSLFRWRIVRFGRKRCCRACSSWRPTRQAEVARGCRFACLAATGSTSCLRVPSMTSGCITHQTTTSSSHHAHRAASRLRIYLRPSP